MLPFSFVPIRHRAAMRWRASLGHRPRVLPAVTLHFVPVVSTWFPTVRAAFRPQPFVSFMRILRQGRRSVDEWLPAALTGQNVTDLAREAPPIGVLSPCLFVNRCTTIIIDSTQPGLTLKRTASGHNASFQIEQSPNVAAMRWRGLILIQASFAASCSAAVGWLYTNFTPPRRPG